MWCTQIYFDNFTPETEFGCNWQQYYLCCSIATCKIFLCKKFFEAYDQTLISFISITNENKNSEDDSDDIQEPHDSDDDVTVDGDYYFSKNKQNNHVFRNGLYEFLGMFDPPDIENDDISEDNYYNSFAIGVVEDK